MADEKVIIEIELDDGSIKKGFAVLKKEGADAGKSVGKSLADGIEGGLGKIGSGTSSVLGSLFSLKSAILGIGAGIAGALGGKAVIDAASESDDAINRLNTSLAMTGISSEDTRKRFKGLAEEIQKTTRFGDDLVMENIALLQSLGNLNANGLDRATRAAVDFSSALQIDLGTAVTLVGKAANGEVGAFSRYGIAIQKGKTDAETFANTLATLETRFSGSAQAQVKTFGGVVAQLGNNFGDFTEKIGELVTRNPVIIKLIGTLSQFFVRLGDSLKENQQAIVDFTNTLIVDFANGIVSTIPIISAFVGVFFDIKIALKSGEAAFVLFTKAMVATAGTLVESLNFGGVFDEQSERLANVSNNLSSKLSDISKESDEIAKSKEGAENFFIGVSEKANSAAKSLENFVIKNRMMLADQAIANQAKIPPPGPDPAKVEEFNKKLFEQTSAAQKERLELMIAGATSQEELDRLTAEKTFFMQQETDAKLAVLREQAQLLNLQDTIEFQNLEVALQEATNQRILAAQKSTQMTTNSILQSIKGSVVNAIAFTAQTIGASLAKGSKSFDKFGMAIVGMMGDMAITIGTTLIAAGIGMEALRASVVGLTGGPALFAGIALVALGGLLKALSGGGEDSAGSSGGIASGGGGATSGGTVAPIDLSPAETVSQRAAVTVNIEGNVFDSKETGLRIADILNEHFDTSNGILAT